MVSDECPCHLTIALTWRSTHDWRRISHYKILTLRTLETGLRLCESLAERNFGSHLTWQRTLLNRTELEYLFQRLNIRQIERSLGLKFVVGTARNIIVSRIEDAALCGCGLEGVLVLGHRRQLAADLISGIEHYFRFRLCRFNGCIFLHRVLGIGRKCEGERTIARNGVLFISSSTIEFRESTLPLPIFRAHARRGWCLWLLRRLMAFVLRAVSQPQAKATLGSERCVLRRCDWLLRVWL